MALPSTNKRFKSRSRLASASGYKRVFDTTHGKSFDRNFMVLAVNNGLNYPRLGLAIAKKKLAAATARNRVKRIVRESFRHHQERLVGLDIVVLNNSNAGSATNSDLFRALAAHWNVVSEQCKKSPS